MPAAKTPTPAPTAFESLRHMPAGLILALTSVAGISLGGAGTSFLGNGVSSEVEIIASNAIKEHNDSHHERLEDQLDRLAEEISDLKAEVHALVALENQWHGRPPTR